MRPHPSASAPVMLGCIHKPPTQPSHPQHTSSQTLMRPRITWGGQTQTPRLLSQTLHHSVRAPESALAQAPPGGSDAGGPRARL